MYLHYEEDIGTGVGDVEDGGARERGHGPLFHVVVQHVSDLAGVAVQVERLGDFPLLFRVVESHDCEYRLNVQVKPAISQ